MRDPFVWTVVVLADVLSVGKESGALAQFMLSVVLSSSLSVVNE